MLKDKPKNRQFLFGREKNSDKRIRFHVKEIRDYIVKDFMENQVKLNDKKLFSTNDTRLKECMNLINKYSDKTDKSTISAYYLTSNESRLKGHKTPGKEQPRITHIHSLKPKNDALYTVSLKKVLSRLPKPKNKLNYVLSTD